MSLKDSALAVLQRNHERNKCATRDKKAMQLNTGSEVNKVAQVTERWSPELAAEGYVWCFYCQHFDSVNCNHSGNPFYTVNKCPQVPRKCQWYEFNKNNQH